MPSQRHGPSKNTTTIIHNPLLLRHGIVFSTAGPFGQVYKCTIFAKIKLDYLLQLFALHALLQKLVGDFFSKGKIGGKFGGNFAGYFLSHRIKAQNYRGKFRSIFRKKIRSSEIILRAKFTLQTCHLKFLFFLQSKLQSDFAEFTIVVA